MMTHDQQTSTSPSLWASLQPYMALLKDTNELIQTDNIANTDHSLQEQMIGEWLARRNNVLAQPIQHPGLLALQQQFNLSQQDLQLVILLLIPQVEPVFRSLYASLHPDNYPVPCLDTLLSLLGIAVEDKAQVSAQLLQQSALTQWQIISLPDRPMNLMGGEVRLATDVVDFLLADTHQQTLSSTTKLTESLGLYQVKPPQHALVPKRRAINPQAKWVQLVGEEGSGRRILAWQHSQSLYALDNDRLWQYTNPQAQLMECLRYLQLHQADLLWPNGLTALASQASILQCLAHWPGQRVYFSETSAQPWPMVLHQEVCQQIMMSAPDIAQAKQLWAAMTQSKHVAKLSKDITQTTINHVLLAQRFPLLPGAIAQVVKNSSELTTESLLVTCIEATPQQLGGLASRVNPSISRDHLVLPMAVHHQLDELLYRFQQSQPLAEAGLANTPGVIALFWGRPGTGKTLCAEALAGELTLPLYKANLANISSKWIGETEKHLAQLFDEVERVNGILFFDEADAVFARRSKVDSSHDKNANLGISYLLQRLETFSGLLILATNFKNNLEPALLRRLHISIEFPIPDKTIRLALWQQWQQKLAFADDVDFALLADKLEISGAQIRNCVQLAYSLMLAEPLDQPEEKEKPEKIVQPVETEKLGNKVIKREHLARAIQREYQKMDSSFLLKQLLQGWSKS